MSVAALTPTREGEENISFVDGLVIAKAGTGFNPDNPIHVGDSDAPRYAIAIQQLRDQREFALADACREKVISYGFEVRMTKYTTSISMRDPLVEFFNRVAPE